MPRQDGSLLKATRDHTGGDPISADSWVSQQSLRESEELSAAPLTDTMSDRKASLYHESASRQHNHRYIEHANEPTEPACLCSEPAESPCSTIIESCSQTESCVTSPSPLPWSPLGRHPLESRCAPLNILQAYTQGMSTKFCDLQSRHVQCGPPQWWSCERKLLPGC